jgi:omega-amidase
LQVGGSIPERANGGRLYNTCLVFGRDGRLLGRHRKVRGSARSPATALCCTGQRCFLHAPNPSLPMLSMLRLLCVLCMLCVLHLQVHLFDIDIPGRITFKESLTLTPGEGPTVVDTEARCRGSRPLPRTRMRGPRTFQPSLPVWPGSL